jgi:hypothetical protein
MFIKNQSRESIATYEKKLKIECLFSKQHSECKNNVPFLHYRSAEGIFCESFNAKDVSREDSSYDAVVGATGIGVKTFICTSNSKTEKVAEFDANHSLRKLDGKKLAVAVAKLRNERINTANEKYNIKDAYYHCISRKNNKLIIFEKDYELIDIDNIEVSKTTKASLQFTDGRNEYNFNRSKSTLMMKFNIPEKDFMSVDIKILDNPRQLLEESFSKYV